MTVGGKSVLIPQWFSFSVSVLLAKALLMERLAVGMPVRPCKLFFKRAGARMQTCKWPWKVRCLGFLLWHGAAIFEDSDQPESGCTMSSDGLLCWEGQRRGSLGRQVPVPSIASWGSLSLCSSEMRQSQMGALETGELRVWCLLAAPWWKAAPFV